jgi:predicted DNA-binding transcriptional regulator AlpA
MPRNPAAAARAPRPGKTLTLAEVRKLPAACRVEDAAAALGVGRATAYELIAAGTFPARVLPVGRRLKVVTASLIELLEARPPAGQERVA